MAEPFLGEIRMVSFLFAPRGWAFCDGQLLAIAQNTALFGLIGTTYGGDGRTTLGLPDLRGRFPVHAGGRAGPGLTRRRSGEKGGEQNHILSVNELPSHNHALNCANGSGNQSSPVNAFPAVVNSLTIKPYSDGADASMASRAIADSGGRQSHNNMPPYLGVNFVIALRGIFPSRS